MNKAPAPKPGIIATARNAYRNITAPENPIPENLREHDLLSAPSRDWRGAVCKVHGEHPDADLWPDDFVEIDFSARQISSGGGVYLVSWDDALLFRRFDILFGKWTDVYIRQVGKWEELSEDALSSLTVHGWVRAVFRNDRNIERRKRFAETWGRA